MRSTTNTHTELVVRPGDSRAGTPSSRPQGKQSGKRTWQKYVLMCAERACPVSLHLCGQPNAVGSIIIPILQMRQLRPTEESKAPTARRRRRRRRQGWEPDARACDSSSMQYRLLPPGVSMSPPGHGLSSQLGEVCREVGPLVGWVIGSCSLTGLFCSKAHIKMNDVSLLYDCLSHQTCSSVPCAEDQQPLHTAGQDLVYLLRFQNLAQDWALYDLTNSLGGRRAGERDRTQASIQYLPIQPSVQPRT